MARNGRGQRRSNLQAKADRQSATVAEKLGKMLRDRRKATHQTQRQAAERAGLSQTGWSLLERGDPRTTLATWNRAAVAVAGTLDAYIRRASATDMPRDATHLRNQELVIRTAATGGWTALPEQAIDRDARTSRAADVLLHRKRATGREYLLVEIWDWFDDVGAAVRDWDRRIAAVERFAVARTAGDDALPRIGGCWVVRATSRNRRLVAEHSHFFRARFPGSSRAWLAAMTDATKAMPLEAALVWVSVSGGRLVAARMA